MIDLESLIDKDLYSYYKSCKGNNLYNNEDIKDLFNWLYSDNGTGCKLIDSINKEYTHEFIFDSWRNNKPFSLGVPILASQYSKALLEYTKFGKLMYFPENEINKMLVNVVKKSIILIKISSMFATTEFLPESFLNSRLLPFYSSLIRKDVKVAKNKFFFRYELSIEEAKERFDGVVPNDVRYDLYNVINEIVRYHHWFPSVRFKLSKDNNIIVYENVISFLQKTDFYGRFYDFKTEEMGLSYIYYYLKLLKDDFTPEEALVWINQMIHIYHYRNDLSKYFIEGGVEALNKIENGLKNEHFRKNNRIS